MTRSDRGRRAVTVVVVALLLLSVPQLALAAFSGRTAPTLAVGSATMVAPANLVGGYTCQRSGGTETMQIDLSGFTDAGPPGATYRYALTARLSSGASASTTSRSVTLNAGQILDPLGTTWTLTVQSTLRGWTSPVTTFAVTCTKGGKSTGSL